MHTYYYCTVHLLVACLWVPSNWHYPQGTLTPILFPPERPFTLLTNDGNMCQQQPFFLPRVLAVFHSFPALYFSCPITLRESDSYEVRTAFRFMLVYVGAELRCYGMMEKMLYSATFFTSCRFIQDASFLLMPQTLAIIAPCFTMCFAKKLHHWI